MNENKELFRELDHHLMQDTAPSRFLTDTRRDFADAGAPYDLLLKLQEVRQSPVYHPEGSVWNHTLLVTDACARFRYEAADPRAFMWAALLHDLGKITATRERRGRITAYGHDVKGEALARRFLCSVTDEAPFTERVCALVRFHMHPLYVEKRMPFADLNALRTRTDPRDVMLLGLCDRLGRTNSDEKEERKKAEAFLERVQKL